jgi:hypothetical protein
MADQAATQLTQTLTIVSPTGTALTAQATMFLEAAKDVVIDSDDMLQIAATELQGIKALGSAWDAKRKSITKPLDDAKKAVMDLFRVPCDTLASAEQIIKRAMSNYAIELDRKREAERRAQEEAARVAGARQAEEAARLEAEAMLTRAKAGEAEAQGNVEAACALTAVADAATAEAQTLALEAAAPVMAALAIAPTKVKGASFADDVQVSVADKLELVRSILDNPTFLYLLDVRAGDLKTAVRKGGDQFPLRGLSVVKTKVVAARTA